MGHLVFLTYDHDSPDRHLQADAVEVECQFWYSRPNIIRVPALFVSQHYSCHLKQKGMYSEGYAISQPYGALHLMAATVPHHCRYC